MLDRLKDFYREITTYPLTPAMRVGAFVLSTIGFVTLLVWIL